MSSLAIGAKRYQQQAREDAAPHTGHMIKRAISTGATTTAAVARRMNRNDSTLHSFQKKGSIQTGILWELCHALRHNFFADIAALLPEDYKTEAQDKQSAALEKMAAELEKVTLERDVLMRVLGK